jgi:hypothetical protein
LQTDALQGLPVLFGQNGRQNMPVTGSEFFLKAFVIALFLKICQQPGKLFAVETGFRTGRAAAAKLLGHCLQASLNPNGHAGVFIRRVWHQRGRLTMKFQALEIPFRCRWVNNGAFQGSEPFSRRFLFVVSIHQDSILGLNFIFV